MFNVIVLDDERLIRFGVTSILQLHGTRYNVVGEASNGEEGLKLIRKLKPDVVIMDIRMPKGTGLDVLKSIKEEGLKCRTIILTAHADFDYARKAIQYQVDSYLLKPINEEELLKELDRITSSPVQEMLLAPEVSIAKEMINEIINRNNKLHPLVYKALRFVGDQFTKDISLREVCEKNGVSPAYFSDLFSKTMGITFVKFLNHFRIDIAKRLMLDYGVKISEVAEKVGFSNPKYFGKVFSDIESVSPSDFINQSRKES